jgi:5S rRNA maturation endonuclease (ribonuclease M5)
MNIQVPTIAARLLPNPPEGAELLRSSPDHVPRPDLRWNGTLPATVHEYRNGDGSLATLIARFETTEGKKIMPVTLWRSPDGRLDWCCKALPDNRPLYRLPNLLAAPDRTVLISEGEKCADAAAGFTNFVSVTWMGGCKAIMKTDLTRLAGRNVIILPDHDEPGQQAAAQLEQTLRDLGAASVQLLDIARLAQECGLESVPGFDIADATAGGLDAARFEALLALPGMLTEVAPSASNAATFNPGDLPEDPVQREILERFGIRPEDIPGYSRSRATG